MKIMPHEMPVKTPRIVETPPAPELPLARAKDINEDDLRYLAYRRMWSSHMIADHYGTSHRSMSSLMETLGIVRPVRLRAANINREALWFLIYENSTAQAGRVLGCSSKVAQDNARKLKAMTPERRSLTFQFDADRRRLYGSSLENNQ